MGKQLSIYLPEEVSRRLLDLAKRECRRPNDQARYILLRTLEGLDEHPAANEGNRANQVLADPSAVAVN